MKKKTILITGGAGFLGSHLCRKLIKNNKIICLDNLSTGFLKNISDLIKNKNFEFVQHDITKPFYRNGIDEIYNLASPASPVQYQKNPIKTIKTSTIGVINMLGLAKINGSKILQASTSEVYGDPQIHPQDEKYNGNVNPVGIRSCYDEGKRVAETLFLDYHREHNIRIKIVRIFNTYGPGMSKNDGRVISNFINQALKSKNITIYGDGTQTRSFMYVDDLVDGLIKIMNSNYEFIGPVNLGSTKEISIKELAIKIIKLCKSKSKLIFLDLPSDDPKMRKPDLSLLNEKINWSAKNELKKGLDKTINFFQNSF